MLKGADRFKTLTRAVLASGLLVAGSVAALPGSAQAVPTFQDSGFDFTVAIGPGLSKDSEPLFAFLDSANSFMRFDNDTGILQLQLAPKNGDIFRFAMMFPDPSGLGIDSANSGYALNIGSGLASGASLTSFGTGFSTLLDTAPATTPNTARMDGLGNFVVGFDKIGSTSVAKDTVALFQIDLTGASSGIAADDITSLGSSDNSGGPTSGGAKIPLWWAAHLASFDNGDGLTSQFIGGTGAEEVPEPGTLALLSAGILGLAVAARRRRKRTAAKA